MRTIKTLAPLLCFCLLCFSAGQHRARHPRASGQSGVFDFYLFVLSWSPEFCHGHPQAAECSQHAGFIVHGLWPQNNDGSYPSNCATSQPGPTNTNSVADIMPREIIQHEWQTHGACSGLSGDAYFALIRRAYDSILIPARFKAPAASFTLQPKQLKQAFEGSNAKLDDAEIAIELQGNYLNAVEFCLAKNATLEPIHCSNVKDANRGTFVVPPVQ